VARYLLAGLFFTLTLLQTEWLFGVPSGWLEGAGLKTWCRWKSHPEACYAWAKREDLSRDLINSVREAPAAAFEGYDRACQKDFAPACTDLSSWLIRKEDYDQAVVAAKKACDMKDSIGCYNLACAYCRKNMKPEAVEYLVLAHQLESTLLNDAQAWNDPDLECLKTDSTFQKLISNR
jgi:TPR repeat protein